MKELQYKNYDAVIKDVDVPSLMVSGYFSTWDNIDMAGDVMMRGCFTKSINERFPKNQIKYLYQHDTWKPLGKLNVLIEDAKGLYFEAKMTDTSFGTDMIKLYRDGVIDQHSIGFQTVKSIEEQISENTEVTRITEVKLWEGSAVTFGCNDDTPFQGFKSYTGKEKQDRIKLLMKTLRDGDLTDDTYSSIEFEILKLSSVNTEAEIITSLNINPTIDELKQMFKEKGII
jgi:HK97 family phage prohead protease